MINQINGINTENFPGSLVDLELLEALLQPEDETYPWNLLDPESENYFEQLEQQFECDDLLGDDFTQRSQDFYQHLDQIWSQVDCSKTDHDEQPSKSIQVSLHENFASFIPSNLLNAIAQKATELMNLERSASEKLVECVQGLLPHWETDDLLVLARPFAYSMRSNEQQNLAVIISNVKDREWTGLSEIEQAKVSLAIAHYTFKELSSSDPES
jgi:hypothetical protein